MFLRYHHLTWARRALPAIVFAVAGCGAAVDSNEDSLNGADSTEEGVTSDQCPVANGISFNDRTRFMYGVNYAWKDFAADFGGNAKWGSPGIAAAAEEHAAKLSDMRAHGASVVRWWVFPEFRGEGVQFDEGGNPVGLGGTALDDLNKALELAERTDTHLMLCLFSFDNFHPTRDVSGLYVRGMSPLLRDANKRRMLLENVVRPLARAAEASPHRDRLVSWDIINEPEWAITGQDPYGDDGYTPDPSLDPVSHAEMEAFIGEAANVLHAESKALVTVGGAAAKWAKAWTHVGLDFYQLHIYDWVNQYWPYDLSPDELGIGDKPVVMGEFPIGGLTGVSYQTLVDSLYENGYAGAMGWQYIEASGQSLAQVSAFHDKHACETSFSGGVTTGDGRSGGGDPPGGGDTQGGGGTCGDTPPDGNYTCEQQAAWGKCGESWMQGFCNKTCGRCPSACSDTPPDGSYSCEQQAGWGKCGESWMQGYCDKSCGRCN